MCVCYSYEQEDYCESCLPVNIDHPDVYENDGERDVPLNCSKCGRFLDKDLTLTPEGIQYVMEFVKESLAQTPDDRNQIIDQKHHGFYYNGQRSCDVIRDWAKHIREYALDEKDRRLVASFLESTE